MTRLTDQQLYAYATQAGFTGTAAVTAVAVALAESGGRSDAVGDVNLTQQGEQSTGPWQVNYRPARDQGNATRDPQANLDPAHNAAAAYAISGNGSTFRPWSTYVSGAYRAFLPRALAAAAKGGANITLPAGTTTATGSPNTSAGGAQNAGLLGNIGGFLVNPFGLVGDAASGIGGDIVSGLGKIVLPASVVLAGLALGVFGVIRATAGSKTVQSLTPAASAAAL